MLKFEESSHGQLKQEVQTLQDIQRKDLLLKVSLKVEEEADSFHELRIYLDLHIPASANSSLQNHLEGEEENSSSKVEQKKESNSSSSNNQEAHQQQQNEQDQSRKNREQFNTEQRKRNDSFCSPMIQLKPSSQLQINDDGLGNQQNSQAKGISVQNSYEHPPLTPFFVPQIRRKQLIDNRSIELEDVSEQPIQYKSNKRELLFDLDANDSPYQLINNPDFQEEKDILQPMQTSQSLHNNEILSSAEQNITLNQLEQAHDSNSSSRVLKHQRTENMNKKLTDSQSVWTQSTILKKKYEDKHKREQQIQSEFWLTGLNSKPEEESNPIKKVNHNQSKLLGKRHNIETNFAHNQDSEEIQEEYSISQVYEVLKKRKIEKINSIISQKEAQKKRQISLFPPAQQFSAAQTPLSQISQSLNLSAPNTSQPQQISQIEGDFIDKKPQETSLKNDTLVSVVNPIKANNQNLPLLTINNISEIKEKDKVDTNETKSSLFEIKAAPIPPPPPKSSQSILPLGLFARVEQKKDTQEEQPKSLFSAINVSSLIKIDNVLGSNLMNGGLFNTSIQFPQKEKKVVEEPPKSLVPESKDKIQKSQDPQPLNQIQQKSQTIILNQNPNLSLFNSVSTNLPPKQDNSVTKKLEAPQQSVGNQLNTSAFGQTTSNFQVPLPNAQLTESKPQQQVNRNNFQLPPGIQYSSSAPPANSLNLQGGLFGNLIKPSSEEGIKLKESNSLFDNKTTPPIISSSTTSGGLFSNLASLPKQNQTGLNVSLGNINQISSNNTTPSFLSIPTQAITRNSIPNNEASTLPQKGEFGNLMKGTAASLFGQNSSVNLFNPSSNKGVLQSTGLFSNLSTSNNKEQSSNFNQQLGLFGKIPNGDQSQQAQKATEEASIKKPEASIFSTLPPKQNGSNLFSKPQSKSLIDVSIQKPMTGGLFDQSQNSSFILSSSSTQQS